MQVCSALYRRGPGALKEIVEGIERWMDGKGYAELSAFRGLMRDTDLTDNAGFERAQYLKAFVGLE